MKIVLASMAVSLSITVQAQADGNFSGFNNQLPKRYSYSKNATAPDGSKAERFEVRSGDCQGTDEDCTTDRERAERFEAKPYSRLNTEYWYKYSIYFPIDFEFTPPANNLFGQFHQRGRGINIVNIGMHGGQPAGYYFELNPFEDGPGIIDQLLIANSELREKWHTIIVNAIWSKSDTGRIRVWVNGQRKIDYTGPNLHRNTPVYFKYGAYRAYVSKYASKLPTQIVYYRDIQRGFSRKDIGMTELN